MRALLKSHNLIGDALNISPALRKWIKQQSSPVDVWFQTLPDHVACLYEGMVRDLWNPRTLVHTFGTVFEKPQGIKFDFEFNFDVSTAFKFCDKNKYHIAEGYAEMLSVKLEGGNERLKPIFIPEDDGVEVIQDTILISMFSASCEGHDPKCNFIPNKQLPFPKWKPIIQLLRTEYPDNPIRFLGAPSDIEVVSKQQLYAQDIVRPGECMFGVPLNRLARIMQKAKLLVTIDNGMSHLGASQEVNMFEMYPRCLGPHYILPVGNRNLAWIQMDPVKVNPAQIVHNLKQAITRFKKEERNE